ncbi:hypothetical protein FD961_06565 [Polynucleobacter sp. TSB-Sco08W16]|uniref:hypothetical protein n=1 Tax=Polynucleobacter sp. TSB-Sco08W16 TaxID=1758374 RepID=UPI001BFE5B93|nr:hypothetical protein [Polynucleobacter sp. TSB-Sco08W16]QWD73745.1 hypothetical protein FD961_06565 [Polynucleobacter sp. TSB-Sco08W16]
MNLSRRTFIASAVLAPVACGVPLGYEHGTPISQPNPLPTVRTPEVGQEWNYVKKDVFNGKTLGIITERVASVGSSINIERSEDGNMLPNEIQSPWGFVSTDPQWPRLLSFNPALPLWPLELSGSWSKQFNTKYSIGGYSDNKLGWQEYMSAHGWERITVPAGTFLTLRYQSLINYESDDDNKVNCIRKETVWFAPQIGRWVAREASGSYQIQGQIGAVINEGSYQWQLTSYK